MISKQPQRTHLVPLSSGEWSVWRWVAVRGAGFPFQWLLQLSAEEVAARADEVLEAESGCTAGEVARARVAYQEGMDRTLPELGETLRRFARRDDVREALQWQNREALRGSIGQFVGSAPEPERRSKERRRERAVLSYLQRYCAKNDTIGFFGPVGWGRLVDEGPALQVDPGPGLVNDRRVYFESWAFDVLSEAFGRDARVLRWQPPRPSPFLLRHGGRLLTLGGHAVELGGDERAVLEACDGRRSAVHLARTLVRDPANGLTDEEEVYAHLRKLRDAGAVLWSLEVPLGLYPERDLREHLERIEDAALRRSMLDRLARLERARDEVADAGGDVDRLGRALEELEGTFTDLTGRPPRRSRKETVTGRGLVYEDCRRDADIRLGPRLMEDLGPPLELLLQSARWFSWQTGHRCLQLLRDTYRELCGAQGAQRAGKIPLAAFLARIQDRLFVNRESFVHRELIPDLKRRWSEVLPILEGERRVRFTSEELRDRVRDVFASEAPGWRVAWYHSPDVMVAAADADAVRRGEVDYVFGEMHLAANTLCTSLFLKMHPDPEELLAAAKEDMAGSRVILDLPKSWQKSSLTRLMGFQPPGMTGRSDYALVTSDDVYLRLSTAPPKGPAARQWTPGELVVSEREDELWVEDVRGRHRIPILDVFGGILNAHVHHAFQIVKRGYTPRVQIDKLVVMRESWLLPIQDTGLTRAATEADRFLQARRWGRRHGMPRFLFVRLPGEPKPMYLDLDSPPMVELLSQYLRKAMDRFGTDVHIRVTEMLPTPEQLWLTDAENRRYTAELRFAVFDRAARDALVGD